MIVEEDGRTTQRSFDDLATASDRVAAWLTGHGVPPSEQDRIHGPAGLEHGSERADVQARGPVRQLPALEAPGQVEVVGRGSVVAESALASGAAPRVAR